MMVGQICAPRYCLPRCPPTGWLLLSAWRWPLSAVVVVVVVVSCRAFRTAGHILIKVTRAYRETMHMHAVRYILMRMREKERTSTHRDPFIIFHAVCASRAGNEVHAHDLAEFITDISRHVHVHVRRRSSFVDVDGDVGGRIPPQRMRKIARASANKNTKPLASRAYVCTYIFCVRMSWRFNDDDDNDVRSSARP